MPRPNLLPSALALSTAALALLSVGFLLGLGQPGNPPSRPAAGDPPLVYAVLTKTGSGYGSVPASSFLWEFTDGIRPIPDAPLRTKLNIRSGAIFDDASMVNGVANLGWDLISHSERALSTSPDVQNGTSSGSGQTSIVEHWWFKRR